jgi:putative two-component system response regulator
MKPGVGVQKWNVLLVEDDSGMREFLAKYLGRAGYEVSAVERAEQVLEARDKVGRPFDLMVSDVHLPGMSGIDLATMMLASTPGLPIVLITGDPDEALAREALSRGPVSYLLKPFQPFELEALMRSALVGQQQRRELPPPVAAVEEEAGDEIPADWLAWVDERSYAGPGHGDRVARLCTLLAGEIPDFVGRVADLQDAAKTHEIGIMKGMSADPIDLAWKGADLLGDLGGRAEVVRIVRHMHERWDGSGGPDALSGGRIPAGSSVLSVADALDHYTAAWLQTGANEPDAVDRAIGLVISQKQLVFSPEVARAVDAKREEIREICGVKRSAPVPAETPTRRARVYQTMGAGR